MTHLHTYRLVLVGLLLAGVPDLQAQDLSAVPAAFVDIGYGARPAALGGAFVAVSEGAYSVIWNPAHAAELPGLSSSFSYVELLGLIEYGQAAIVWPMRSRRFGLGVAVSSAGDDALREMTATAVMASGMGPITLGVAVHYRQATFGRNALDPGDFVVFDPDEIAEGIANQISGDGTGLGVDVGLLIMAGRWASFAAVARNLLAPFEWNASVASVARPSYSEAIPREFVVGAALYPSNNLMFTLDFRPAHDRELDHAVRIGAEWELLGILALRAGTGRLLNGRVDERYAYGFGLRLPAVGGLRLAADFAQVHEVLGTTRQAALRVEFE